MTEPRPIEDLETPPDAVLAISAEITVDAPASHVFQIHCDTSKWPEWNSFVPAADVSSTTSPTADESGRTLLSVGATLNLHVKMTPDSSIRVQKEKVVKYETPDDGDDETSYKVAWEVANFPRFTMRGRRETEVVPLEDNKCQFKTWEFMAGPLAYVVRRMYGAALQERMQDWARDIKAYAEKTLHEEQ